MFHVFINLLIILLILRVDLLFPDPTMIETIKYYVWGNVLQDRHPEAVS